MENESKKKKISKIALIIGIVIIAFIGLQILIAVGVVGIFVIGSATAQPEVYEDVAHYTEYMSFHTNGTDTKWSKWGMDEEIWPKEITDTMEVYDFKMVYYAPWDKQYLGYLVIDYPEEEYIKERERLKQYPSTDYIGYYGVVEETTYELLAVNADAYQGFVYALTDGKGRIIYAEQIFCNYYMDLDYDKYIPEEYLLDGFDARQDNDYEKNMMSR